MYEVRLDDQVRHEIEALPPEALADFAEVMVFLELTPLSGPLRGPGGRGSIRYVLFGPHGAGLVLYSVLEQHRETILITVMWIG